MPVFAASQLPSTAHRSTAATASATRSTSARDRSSSPVVLTRLFIVELLYVVGALACGVMTAAVRGSSDADALAWLTTAVTAPIIGLVAGAARSRFAPDANVLRWMFWCAVGVFVLNAIDALELAGRLI